MNKYQVEYTVEHEHGLLCFMVYAPNEKIAEQEGRRKLLKTFPAYSERKIKTYKIIEVRM